MGEGQVWLWIVLQVVVGIVHCACSVPEGEYE